ncbi:MAG: hypothetical protein P4L84_30005 [Isosphaeraceae bacterium]|nr:hypothetical protein [Isosphaeraceae bacterium]
MRKPSKRVLIVGSVLATLVTAPALVWVSLSYEPQFYRTMNKLPRAQREAEAKRFVAQSLQLSNNIRNEPVWEAVFSDEEVNAWLAEDLVTQFADQLPPEVHDPRVAFETDRVTLAFRLEQGPVKSVIWVVARPRVPEGNVLELTLEKIRAGVLPVPADDVLDRIAEHVRARGVDVSWKRVDGRPVVLVRYQPDADREDVELETVQISAGQVRLTGKSNRERGIVRAPKLPTRKVLQSRFFRRNTQASGGPDSPARGLHRSAVPTS